MSALIASAVGQMDLAARNAPPSQLKKSHKFGSGFKRFAEVVPKEIVKLVILSVTSVGIATGLTSFIVPWENILGFRY